MPRPDRRADRAAHPDAPLGLPRNAATGRSYSGDYLLACQPAANPLLAVSDTVREAVS